MAQRIVHFPTAEGHTDGDEENMPEGCWTIRPVLSEACVGTMVMRFPHCTLCQQHTGRDAAPNSTPFCFKIIQFEKLMCNLATRHG